jgi:hypothetical protein
MVEKYFLGNNGFQIDQNDILFGYSDSRVATLFKGSPLEPLTLSNFYPALNEQSSSRAN